MNRHFLHLFLFILLISCGAPSPASTPTGDEPARFTLTLEVEGAGRVTSGGDASCRSVCTARYDAGSVLSLSALPDPGYTFASWGGSCRSVTGATCTLNVTNNLTVQAVFEAVDAGPTPDPAPGPSPAPDPVPDPSPTPNPVPDPAPKPPPEPEPAPDPNEKTLTLHFIDVGQGDSVLIQGTSGQTVLYDGGRGNGDALPYLQAIGITKLDLVIASHADADHIGGLDAVVDYYKPTFFMDNGQVATTQAYQDLLEAVARAGSQLLEPTRRSVSLGDAALDIIPPPGSEAFDSNNNSIGVLLDFGDFEAALTGDAEGAEMAWWLANTPQYLQAVEVYKSAHHGSKNGDTRSSVDTWQPETVVVSVGATNPYGHPSPEALALYESVGADVYRTDLSGTVIVTAYADGHYVVTTSGLAEPVPAPDPAPAPEPSPAPEPNPNPPANQPPEARFTSSPTTGPAPLTVTFDASTSADPDGSVSAYAWDFGDGGADRGRTVQHTFNAPGSYSVSLTVTDNDGATDAATTTITVAARVQDGDAEVVCVYYNPPGNDDGREYVRIRALGTVDFSGWSVVDAKSHRFALPAVQASAGEVVTVPNPGGAAWNNRGGDTAYLYNRSGSLVDTHSYRGGREGVCE